MSGLLCRVGGSCPQALQDYGARAEKGAASRVNGTSLVAVGVAGCTTRSLPSVRRLASQAARRRAGPKLSGWRVPRANPTAQRAAAPVSKEPSAEPIISGTRVAFVLTRACDFGQYYAVLGEPKSLGAWDPGKAAPLVWSEGNMWTVEVVVPYADQLEFKLVLVASPTSVYWQPGPNRVLNSKGAEALRVTVPWEAEPLIVERVDAAPPGQGQGHTGEGADMDSYFPLKRAPPSVFPRGPMAPVGGPGAGVRWERERETPAWDPIGEAPLRRVEDVRAEEADNGSVEAFQSVEASDLVGSTPVFFETAKKVEERLEAARRLLDRAKDAFAAATATATEIKKQAAGFPVLAPEVLVPPQAPAAGGHENNGGVASASPVPSPLASGDHPPPPPTSLPPPQTSFPATPFPGRSAATAGGAPRARSRSRSRSPSPRRVALPSDPLWKDLVFPAAVEGDPLDVARAWLMEKTMREIRHLARERGLRGDTKVEIINLLLGLGGPSPAAPTTNTPAPAPTRFPTATTTPSFPPTTGRPPPPIFPRVPSHPTAPTPPAIRPPPPAPTSPTVAALNGAGSSQSGANGRAGTPAVGGVGEDEDEENVLVQALQEKSMAELRAMGREWGLRGDTKEELIELLVKVLTPGPTDQAAAQARAQRASQMGLPYVEAPEAEGGKALVGAPGEPAAGRPWDTVFGGKRGAVNGSAISESVNGSVKHEPVKEPFKVREPGVASGGKTEEELLEELGTKSMGELRGMGRKNNIRGDTKGELIRLLAAFLAGAGSTSTERAFGAQQGVVKSPSNGAGFAPRPLVPVGTAAVVTSAKSVGAVNGGSVANADERVEQLQALTMGELRVLGRVHGIRGDTKAELLRLIVAAEGRGVSTGGSGSEAKLSTGFAGTGATNGAVHHPVELASAVAVGQKENSSTRDVEAWKEALFEKSMLELRALARENGVRGDTRDDIIKQLVAVVVA